MKRGKTPATVLSAGVRIIAKDLFCQQAWRMEQIIKTHFVRSAKTGRIYPMLAHLAEEKQNG